VSKVIFSLAALLVLAGCISLPQTEALRESGYAGLPARVELVDVPYYAQEDLMCGPTSLAMALNAVGVDAKVASLTEQVYLPGREGSLQIEMLAAARRNGALAYQLAPELRAVLQEVAAGTPVVALLNISGVKFWPVWHYAVVVGYDLEREEIILRSGPNPRRVTEVGFFEFLWKDGGYWAMAAVPPDRVPATAREQPYAAAVAALERVRRPEAGKAYRALLSRWPENLVGLIGLGNTEHAAGNLAAAESAFRRAVAAHPRSAVALNNLAQTLADLGRLEEAEAVAHSAVAIGGATLPAAQSTLAQIIEKRSKAGVK
jgi:tetratricopeptide (TPR) repeat protein